jgi:hypothetical protein
VAGCCECGDEPSGSCATELVSQLAVARRPALEYTQPLLPTGTGSTIIVKKLAE